MPDLPTDACRARSRRVAALCGALLLSAIAAAALTAALDHYQILQKRRAWAERSFVARPGMIPVPTVDMWRPEALSPGAAAPDFTLVDARTGARVGLSDYRGRPVVLLLSSFG